jgi:hypothetical protein
MALSGIFTTQNHFNQRLSGTWTTLVTPLPPADVTAGWWGAGSPNSSSTVSRLTFATDTSSGSIRGPLNVARIYLAGGGNTTDLWFAGGYQTGGGGPKSTIERITFATDTATASERGTMVYGRYYISGINDKLSNAWFGGGYVTTRRSSVDRITFATDTATATARGALTSPTQMMVGVSSTTDGWFCGGFIAAGPVSTVNRVTYATDTSTPSLRGYLTQSRFGGGGVASTIYGWIAGGYGGPAPENIVSTVDRITFATDTANASLRGPLSSTRRYMSGAGNISDGWFGGGGGNSTPSVTSLVERITYATDTATAAPRGPLGAATRYGAAGAGIQ